MRCVRYFPFSSFLISIYAVASLWLANASQTNFLSIVSSILWVIVFCLGVYLLCRLFTRNAVKATLLTNLILLLFLYFGHISTITTNLTLFNIYLGRYRYLIVLWVLLLFLGTFFIFKSKKKYSLANQIFNYTSVILAFIVVVQLGFHYYAISSSKINAANVSSMETTQPVADNNEPDIYYIIADSYSRQDVLQNHFGLDISDYIEQLESMGFVVSKCSMSNYQHTQEAMASTLNMNYLTEMNLPIDLIRQQNDSYDLSSIIKDSAVRSEFEKLDYQFITFQSSYPALNMPDSDIYFDWQDNTPFYDKIESINFNYLFLRTTALRVIIDAQEAHPEKFDVLPVWILKLVNPRATYFRSRDYLQYQENKFDLETLHTISEIPGKKFVYAHLLVTHEPFVFNTDGTLRESNTYDNSAYKDQIIYLNTQLLEIVENILADSETPPIIIIQGDHSHYSEGRSYIFNAYYLPGGVDSQVYMSITPVNTFRLIFDNYFGGNYGLLPDVSYTEDISVPLDVTDYQQNCLP